MILTIVDSMQPLNSHLAPTWWERSRLGNSVLLFSVDLSVSVQNSAFSCFLLKIYSISMFKCNRFIVSSVFSKKWRWAKRKATNRHLYVKVCTYALAIDKWGLFYNWEFLACFYFKNFFSPVLKSTVGV